MLERIMNAMYAGVHSPKMKEVSWAILASYPLPSALPVIVVWWTWLVKIWT